MPPFFIAACLVLRSQDTLVKRNGDTLLVKLTEVNPYDVRYTLQNYPDGPVFNVFKEDLKFIHYGNGYRESYENYIAPYRLIKPDEDLRILYTENHFYYREHRISEADMLGIAGRLDDRKLNHMIHRIESIKLLQKICTYATLPLVLTGALVYRANSATLGRRGRPGTFPSAQGQRNGIILMLCGLGTSIFSVSLYIDRRRNDKLLVNAL